MKLLNWFLYSLLVILVILALPTMAQAKVVVEFTESVEIASERMLLGEIAKIQGDGSIANTLKGVDLGPAPLPGRKFTLTQETVLGNILQRGVNINDFELRGIPRKGVTVLGAGQTLSRERVLEQAKSYILGRIPAQFSKVDILLKSTFPEIWLPLGEYQVEVGPHNSTRAWGYISLPVKVLRNGKEYSRFNISLDVRVFQSVLVALTPIERGAVITETMMEEKYMDVTQVFGDPAFLKTEIVGKVTKRSIGKGTIIFRDYVEEPKVIRRNDPVVILVVIGEIMVQTAGKALGDGALGEWIEVTNLNTGVRIQAKVIGPGQVQAKVD